MGENWKIFLYKKLSSVINGCGVERHSESAVSSSANLVLDIGSTARGVKTEWVPLPWFESAHLVIARGSAGKHCSILLILLVEAMCVCQHSDTIATMTLINYYYCSTMYCIKY